MNYINNINPIYARPGVAHTVVSPGMGYSIQDINKLIQKNLKLPDIFNNYAVFIKCNGILGNDASFDITITDQTYDPIYTTFEIRDFNKPEPVKNTTQIAIENLLTTFATSDTKDLLTYNTITEIHDVILPQVKNKVGLKYMENVKSISIETIKSTSVTVRIVSSNNSDTLFVKSIDVTGFSNTLTTKNRKAKAVVASAYLPRKLNRMDNWLYNLIIHGDAFSYKTSGGKFIKYLYDINFPEFSTHTEDTSVNINSTRELLDDIYKEIDSAKLMEGDLVKESYPASVDGFESIIQVKIKDWRLT